MKNIEIFEAISGLLLADLYEHFPLRIKIHPSDLAMRLDDGKWEESQEPITEDGNVTTYIRHKSPAGLAKPTIEWLASAGFITFDQYDDGDFIGVCLTPKGLESIKSDETRPNRLIEAAKGLLVDSTKDAVRGQLRKIASEIFSWGVKNAPTIYQTVSKLIEQ